MSEKLNINKTNTAVLIMDYQNDVLSEIPEEPRQVLIHNAVDVLDASREAALAVIHVANFFRPGYPEINDRNRIWRQVKTRGMYRHGSLGASIHSAVSPLPDEILIAKNRASAFHDTGLETVLRVKGITQLVMLGVATEGCVLSTVRQAADLDYSIIVISDGCADPDPEVHEALVRKIFPREAVVITAAEFLLAVKHGILKVNA